MAESALEEQETEPLVSGIPVSHFVCHDLRILHILPTTVQFGSGCAKCFHNMKGDALTQQLDEDIESGQGKIGYTVYVPGTCCLASF